jgi:hypothetical protein
VSGHRSACARPPTLPSQEPQKSSHARPQAAGRSIPIFVQTAVQQSAGKPAIYLDTLINMVVAAGLHVELRAGSSLIEFGCAAQAEERGWNGLLNVTAAPCVRQHQANHCWSICVTAKHASAGPGRWPATVPPLRKNKSRSKAPERFSSVMDNLVERFASISAPPVEHRCIGSLRSDRTCASWRSARSPILTSPRHRRPYSRRRSTPGRCFRRA